MAYPTYKELDALQACYADAYSRKATREGSGITITPISAREHSTPAQQKENFITARERLRDIVLAVVGIDALMETLNDPAHNDHVVATTCHNIQRLARLPDEKSARGR